jgi:hypothetical protein
MGMLKGTYGLPVPLSTDRHIWVSPVGLVVAPLGYQIILNQTFEY